MHATLWQRPSIIQAFMLIIQAFKLIITEIYYYVCMYMSVCVCVCVCVCACVCLCVPVHACMHMTATLDSKYKNAIK